MSSNTSSSELFLPKRLAAVLVVLLGIHHFRSNIYNQTDQSDQETSRSEDDINREDDVKYASEETKRRQEKLDQLLSRKCESMEDVDELLDAIEEYQSALEYLSRNGRRESLHDIPDPWKDKRIEAGYLAAGECLGELLTPQSKDNTQAEHLIPTSNHGEILDGPVKKLREQLLRCPWLEFTRRVEATFRKQAAEAAFSIRRKRLSQLLKAGIVLKRALPESPMIAISSILSIYSGMLESARLYLRGEMLTRAINLATGGAVDAKTVNSFSLKNLVILEFLAALVAVLKERAQTIGKRRFVQNLKTDLFAALVSQDMVYFEKNDLWETRHLIGNADAVCTALLSTPTTTLESFSRVLSSALLLAKQSPSLAGFVFLVALPSKHVLNSWLDGLSDTIERSKATLFVPSKSFADVWQTLVDPKALKTMRAFAREPIEVQDFSRSVRAKDMQDESSALAYQLISPARDVLDKLLDVFGVWYGGMLVGERSMRAADLPSFVALCSDTFDRARYLYSSVGAFGVDVLEPVERMHDLLTSKPKIGLYVPPYPKSSSIQFSVEFKNVRFAYPTRPHAEILRGVSFKINRGERIGIMGESGCGKSTLFSLIERFYEPTQGEILIGNKPLSDHNPLYLRERIAWVSQQSFMAKRTVKENLLYGRRRTRSHQSPQGTRQSEEDEAREIHRVLELAQCSFFLTDNIRFPDGLLTDIGPNASKLSGGEVQRLALARALLCDPKPELLLLDEYTSALDETSQRNVQIAIDSIWEHSHGEMTILSIAHRISNFKNVDRVIAMSKEGIVAEIGKPRDLLINYPNGIFSTFVKTSEVDFLAAE